MASRSAALLATAATVLAFWFPWLVIGLTGGLSVLLLTYPLLRQHRAGRPERCQRIAEAWEPGNGTPLTFAFLCGGPGRVTDLVLFELHEAGKLRLSGEGVVRYTGERTARPSTSDLAGAWRVSPTLHQLHRSLHAAVLYQPDSRDQIPVRELRRIVAARPEIGKLWYQLARVGLVSSRRQLRWIHKGLRIAVALLAIPLTVATIALLARTDPPLVAWGLLLAGAVAVALLGDAYLRVLPRRLTGFHTDLRTAAGLRASELVDVAGKDADRGRVVRYGLRQPRPGIGGSGSTVEPSFWWVVPVDSSRPVPFRARRLRSVRPDRPEADASDGSAWHAATELGSAWVDHYSSSQGDGGSDGGGGGGGGGGSGDGDSGGDWN